MSEKWTSGRCVECCREIPDERYHDWDCPNAPARMVRVLEGWGDAGKVGVRLGPDVHPGGNAWTPVLFRDEDDPTFYKWRALEFKDVTLVPEFEIGENAAITIRTVDPTDKMDGRVTIEAHEGEDARALTFPMPMLGQLVSIMLRESGVATYRFSRQTGRHQISVIKGRCVSEVGAWH